jgi:hypothetical protein
MRTSVAAWLEADVARARRLSMKTITTAMAGLFILPVIQTLIHMRKP